MTMHPSTDAFRLAAHPDLARLRSVWSGDDSGRSPPLGVDLFAGAGGFSLGALGAGVRIVAAVEMQKAACATYRRNLVGMAGARTELFEGDIQHLDPSVLMERTGLRAGACDILLGGPPCQGFSTHRIRGSGVGDARNGLLLRYFEFVAALRPRTFLVENVPGMLWPRHRSFVDRFYELADEHGYDLEPPATLNARDYGIPQSRARVFLFGRERGHPGTTWPPAPTHSESGLDGKERWVPASTVFDAPLPEHDANAIRMMSGPSLVEAFRATPANGGSRRDSGRVLRCHDGHSGHSDVYGRIDPSIPGPTMTTGCINPSKGRFVHPVEHHGITLRQAARFQTFPDWFEFGGGLMSGGVQVGNAVPVDLARMLVEATLGLGATGPA